MSKALKETILTILDNEPYKRMSIIEDEPFIHKIKKVVNHTYFKPFDEIISNTYAKDIVDLLWNYYIDTHIKNNQENKLFDINKEGILIEKRVDKKIKKDITTVRSFLNLMQENSIYNNSIEATYTNKQDVKFIYDYCQKIIEDLETKKFDISMTYKITQLEITLKQDVKQFFKELIKEHNLNIQDYKIDNLISLLKKN